MECSRAVCAGPRPRRAAADEERGPRPASRPRARVGRLALAVALPVIVAGCVGTGADPGAAASGLFARSRSDLAHQGRVDTRGATSPAADPGRVGAEPSHGGPPAAAGRPDVAPPGLVGKDWIAPSAAGRRSVAGVVGSPARLVLPPGEIALAAAGDSVAVVAYDGDGTASRVRVRGIRDGRPSAEASLPLQVDAAAFAGDRLLVSGHDPGRTGVDPGVVAVSLTDGSTAPLIGPSAAPDPSAPYVRSVRTSPSGRTAVSGLCTAGSCSIDVIDPATGSTRPIVASGPDLPGVLTDSVLLVGSPDSSSLAGIELATGRRLWERTGAEYQYAYATDDGAIVLSYVDHAGPFSFVVARLDPLTGDERVLLRRDLADGLTLWPALSTSSVAVIGTGGRFEDLAASQDVVHAGALDLASATFEPDAVEIQVAP